jgi:hypothetical protein
MSLKPSPSRLVQLAQDSPLEQQAEEREAQIRRHFEAPAPMILRKAQPEAAPEPQLASLPAAEAAPAGVQMAQALPLPTARIIQTQVATSGATASQATSPAAGGEQAQAPDVQKLAEQVYRLIKSRLRLERERLGLR